MEMGLKGRIAAVSPYLLISRDPKEWPGGIDGRPVTFGKFRTLDAGDLVKVHNIVSSSRLGDRFITFWERVRVERNTLVHTASHPLIEPAYLVRSILTAAQALFSEMSWPKQLREMLDTDQYAALGLDDSNHNYVMRQIEAAVGYLEPAEARLFLGFDKGRRSYVCPSCYEQANRDWQSNWPKLAQLRSRAVNEISLVCVVCEEVSTVERISCVREGCLGNVVKDGICLICVSAQDEPARSNSKLDEVTSPGSHLYHFQIGRSRTTILDNGHYPSDEAAIEDVRRRMEAPHAKSWTTALVKRGDRGWSRGQELGTWIRKGPHLVWMEQLS